MRKRERRTILIGGGLYPFPLMSKGEKREVKQISKDLKRLSKGGATICFTTYVSINAKGEYGVGIDVSMNKLMRLLAT